MSVILGVMTAIVLIVWGMLHKAKARHSAAPVLVKRYIHAGHTWMRETEDGDVLVGIDDFAQSVIGTIEEIELPSLLKRLVQGNPGWKVKHGHRLVPMVSPVSGRVIEKNEMVLRNPLLINSSPYGDGWLLRVRPTRLNMQLNNLFSGRAASQWLERAREQVIRMFTTTPALMYQDGGLLIKDLADRVSDAEWDVLAKELFLMDAHRDDHVPDSHNRIQ